MANFIYKDTNKKFPHDIELGIKLNILVEKQMP